ncbi:MAG: hypothetical protein HXK16_08210 [Alloprevotella sp.]|nr:hypothetical protein [Alloprevotella sp.]
MEKNTNSETMCFFNITGKDKINKILASLETDVVDYMSKARSSISIRNNSSYLVVKGQEIRNQLSQLSNIIDNGGGTFLFTDFQFTGQQDSLATIIWAVTEFINKTERQINLNK